MNESLHSLPGRISHPSVSVAVVGAGITGLCAAQRLMDLGIPVEVYEASSRAGGVIRTVSSDGYLAEEGPNTLLAPAPWIHPWIQNLGLGVDCLRSNPDAERRYLVRNGSPIPVPRSIGGWIKTPLLSTAGKVRVLGDLFIPRPEDSLEESVGSFVRRRLGQELLDYAINPLVAGIYAGDPERLSVREAFPRLHRVERRFRSLLLGQFGVAREHRRSGEIPRDRAPKLSFRSGLESLPRAFAERLGPRLHLDSPVTAIRRQESHWELSIGPERRRVTHTGLVLTSPAHRLALVDWETEAGEDLRWLGTLRHAPISTLVLGFRRDQVAHPLDGFGVLVPEVERIPILGVLFNSTLFPDRAPKGHVTLTCYLGGSRDPELAVAAPDRQLSQTLHALRSLLGVDGNPTFIHHKIHNPGIPQYEMGFGGFLERFKALESRHPHLRFAGYSRNGIALLDCIVSGRDAAESLHQELTRSGQDSSDSRLPQPSHTPTTTPIPPIRMKTQDASKTGVLIINLGSPDSPSVSDVRTYLGEFLMDGRVIDVPWPIRFLIVRGIIQPFRSAKSAEAYREIWTPEGSPLVTMGRRVQSALQTEIGLPVALAMRYRLPTVDEALESLRSAGVTNVVVVPLFPHYAMSSYESAVVEVQRCRDKSFPMLQLRICPPYFAHPSYIAALVNSCEPWTRGTWDHLLVSFHGIPERHIKKSDPTHGHCLASGNCCAVPSPAHASCYRHQCFQTARLLTEKAGLPPDRVSVSFQSRLGRDAWLKPYTEPELIRLAQSGVRRLLVVCPAFVADCLETLEEIAVRGREVFLHHGGTELELIPCLNDHPDWIQALGDLVRETAAREG